MNIGDIFASKYQVVGKLGYSVTSTVWLARDLQDLRYRLPDGIFTEELLKNSLKQLFLAIDYIHTEYIKADNIFSQIEDESILDAFTNAEMRNPSPRKSINGVTVYTSRQLEIPKFFGDSVLSDFGSVVRGDEKRNHNAGPQIYRVVLYCVFSGLCL
ncbi:hypothetical protein SS1G_09294 [Sclerotinia sclerotiorum 1980 UF-70]|uniref:Protein kinase domain-containing protein n=1 Tax=Sclerotinia sclerotiorum (strain ATCC 18683 / 1980 / Ss-1) TaxID=665079 RepID=A7EVD6_SCLS1|nr:hypothetical protein SS1G_09294 [Sclerotinia sclerotiorum 1980 UF-70]EDN93428.1 hypothetical protein SS1G_09294 [Sclerotinia sclerotiorum 1980 UF-70]